MCILMLPKHTDPVPTHEDYLLGDHVVNQAGATSATGNFGMGGSFVSGSFASNVLVSQHTQQQAPGPHSHQLLCASCHRPEGEVNFSANQKKNKSTARCNQCVQPPQWQQYQSTGGKGKGKGKQGGKGLCKFGLACTRTDWCESGNNHVHTFRITQNKTNCTIVLQPIYCFECVFDPHAYGEQSFFFFFALQLV